MAGRRGKGWWEGYRHQLPVGFLDIAEMEWHARRLRIALSVHLPGLLQTEEHALCGEGANCFRLGTDSQGNAYIAVAGQEDRYLTDTREALAALIRDIKAGKADHLI